MLICALMSLLYMSSTDPQKLHKSNFAGMSLKPQTGIKCTFYSYHYISWFLNNRVLKVPAQNQTAHRVRQRSVDEPQNEPWVEENFMCK